jgi:LAS superfamily LD-carboxypeptidase LdcB
MHYLSKLIPVAMLAVLLIGCEKEELNYAYLMRHPFALEKEYNRCQSLRLTDPEQQTQCKMVNEAAKQIAEIMSQQRNHPEMFGQRILLAETKTSDLTAQLAVEKNNLAELKSKAGSAEQIKVQQSKINDIQKDLTAEQSEVKILLAVMGLSTPE